MSLRDFKLFLKIIQRKEVIYWVECLLYKPEDLNVYPYHPCKKTHTVLHVCNSSAEMVRIQK